MINKPKKIAIWSSLKTEVIDKLDHIATQRKWSRPQIIREAIEFYLKSNKVSI